MKLEELPGWARELIASARVGRLAYSDLEGLPRLLPVTFAEWDGAIWSAIDEKPKRRPEPARVEALRRRPEAALLVDVYDDDWSRLAWVQLLGRVTVLERGEAPAAAFSELAAKYRPYAERTPPGPLLRFDVERPLCWRAAGD